MEQKLTPCKICGNEIAVSAKRCPHCGAKIKKPFFKKWWFWLLVVLVVGMMASGGNQEKTPRSSPAPSIESSLPKANAEKPQHSSAAPSATPEAAPELSSTPEPEKEEETMGQKNALRSAKNYLNVMAFSYTGLIKQLEFEGYSTEDATYAADHCDADWNEQAAKSAKNYLDIMSFSKSGLIEQLEFEGFTHAQATYGAEANGY